MEIAGIFWDENSKKWLWVNIGSFIIGTIVFWWFLSIGIINLMTAFFLAILNFLVIPLAYYFLKYFVESKHQKIISKIMLVGCFGYALSVPIWLITVNLLIVAPWAPFQDLSIPLRNLFLPLLMLPSYGLAAYIMYRIGKKRDWRPPSYYID
ncbi:MAG TPA: hypothetical protein ENH75_05320 [archaeon]|nr:hypothetical protein [archaeon]